MFRDGIEPGGNGILGFFDIKLIDPTWVLSAPYECVELEQDSILFCPVVNGIALGKIEFATSRFDLDSQAFVFRGNLVPVFREIRRNFAINRNVADELCG
jgi:hypothetical protein